MASATLPNSDVIRHTAPGAVSRRVPMLDGVRGIAIALVLFHHYVNTVTDSNANRFLHMVHAFGVVAWSGVDLFFVLSGFLLGGILLENRDAPNLLRVFYVRRTCRIFPLYFAFLLIFIALVKLWPGRPRSAFANPLPLWTYASYMQNFAMAYRGDFGAAWMATTWSLANEEQFYLILPPLVLLLRYRSLVAALIVLVAAAPFCRWLALRYSSGLHAAYVLLPCRWDSLFLGVIGALLMRRPAFVKSVSQRIGLLYTAAAVFAVMVVLNGGRATGTVMLFTWIAMFYLSLILIVMMSPNATLKRMLSARWLTGLGSIAYGVYLLHVPIAAICFHVAGYPELWITDWRCILLILAALALTIAVARTSYRFFESPLIRLGHTVAYARRADTSTEVEVPVP